MPRPCLLCGKSTYGSIGAAGLKWSFICQPCKDAEDAALSKELLERKKEIEDILKKVLGER